MHKPFYAAITPSYRFGILLVLIYSGAIIALSLAAVPLWGKIGLSLALVVHCGITLRKQVWLLGKHSVRKLGQQADGQWWAQTASGTAFPLQLQPDSLRTPSLLILNFMALEHHQRFCSVIFKDALPQDSFRQLYVRVKAASRYFSRHCESER